MTRSIKARANKRRSAKRIWNSLVQKLSNKTTPELTIDEYDVSVFYSPDEEDRHERHMKGIREAQENKL